MRKRTKQNDKNIKNRSPKITRKKKIGTVNPESLSLPILQKKNLYPTFNELAKLSFKAETLKNESDKLEQNFYDMLNVEDSNNFCKYKKWQLDFQQRLAQRQQELQAFSRMLPTFRTTSNPNNSDLIAMKPKHFDSDNLTYTLLLNNNYRKFFSLPDINSQNDELKKLIDEQKNELDLLNARLNLFRQCYQRDNPKMTVHALMNKTIPSPAAARSPDRTMEFNVEKKVLQEQLQEIIQQRKSILNARTAQKMKRREERKKNQSATRIQKVWRGYKTRQDFKLQKASATKIQKVWRGYKVRNPERVAEAKKFYDTTKNPYYFLEAFHQSKPQAPSQKTYSQRSPRAPSIKQRVSTPEHERTCQQNETSINEQEENNINQEEQEQVNENNNQNEANSTQETETEIEEAKQEQEQNQGNENETITQENSNENENQTNSEQNNETVSTEQELQNEQNQEETEKPLENDDNNTTTENSSEIPNQIEETKSQEETIENVGNSNESNDNINNETTTNEDTNNVENTEHDETSPVSPQETQQNNNEESEEQNQKEDNE